MSDLEVFGKAAPGTGSPSKERGDCPFTQRVFLELEELGLPYTATYIQEGPNKPHWFMVKNPSGLMPVLRDGETWIQDSDKIAEYLDKHYAGNTLKIPVEFRDVGDKIFPIFTKWLQSKDPGSPCRDEFVEELVGFDRHLQNHGPYIAGERPTDSDFALAPKLRHARVALAHFMDFRFPQELGAVQSYMNIVNHGIPHFLIDEIKAVAKDFFNLPLEEKQKSAPQGGDPQGYGQMFVTAEDQTLDWGDLLALSLKPNQIKNLALWPTVPTNFRDTVARYESEVERVAQELLSLFAENLHLEDADYFKNVFGSEPMNLMRMNFYPPCPRPDLVLGLSSHSDGGGITLLLQDDETEGLHVRKNNQWIPVKPIPYALVINIGDLVEVMTNGNYKSIEHRAVTNQERARLSIANFYNPGVDAEVAPSPKLVDEHHPCLYKKFIHIDYIRYHLAKQLKGKRNLADFAKIDISKT